MLDIGVTIQLYSNEGGSLQNVKGLKNIRIHIGAHILSVRHICGFRGAEGCSSKKGKA